MGFRDLHSSFESTTSAVLSSSLFKTKEEEDLPTLLFSEESDADSYEEEDWGMFPLYDSCSSHSFQESKHFLAVVASMAQNPSNNGSDVPSPNQIPYDGSTLQVVGELQVRQNQSLMEHREGLLECLGPLLGSNTETPVLPTATLSSHRTVFAHNRSNNDESTQQLGKLDRDHPVPAPRRGAAADQAGMKRPAAWNAIMDVDKAFLDPHAPWGGAVEEQKGQDLTHMMPEMVSSSAMSVVPRRARKKSRTSRTNPFSAAALRSTETPSGSAYSHQEVDLTEHQETLWETRYRELAAYQKHHGNCLVRFSFAENTPLAKWVKRQRYQYKLKSLGKRSTMTAERQKSLEKLGFVWDLHKVVWGERLSELIEYKRQNGHCNVPSKYKGNHSLSVWVQVQRRQYKLYKDNDTRSYMTIERIAQLEAIGFVWKPR